MSKYYIIKKQTKEQNKKNVKEFIKELGFFLLSLFIATTISILAWT